MLNLSVKNLNQIQSNDYDVMQTYPNTLNAHLSIDFIFVNTVYLGVRYRDVSKDWSISYQSSPVDIYEFPRNDIIYTCT